jgi:hypothetical protein
MIIETGKTHNHTLVSDSLRSPHSFALAMKNITNSLQNLQVSEMDGIVPFLDQNELAYLLAHLQPILEEHDFGKIEIYLDLEQLQVAHYPSLYSDDKDLGDILDMIQNSGVYDQHELDFLALRSLVTLSWPEPKSNEHVEYMAKIETALNIAMIKVAQYIRSRHPERAVWLPYWARLAHFNLLENLPEPLQNQFGPDGIPCFVLRSRDINAHTFPLSNGQAIGIDYALEPFLKNINSFLHSYYRSREIAGPKRIHRAFTELLPRVLFFKGLVPPQAIPPLSLLFGEEAVLSVKATTDAQISFLITHEIGHIALQHPGSRAAFSAKGRHNKEMNYLDFEHMYEYEADAFAMEWQRSNVLNTFRYHLHPKRTSDSEKVTSTIQSLNESLHDFAHFQLSVETLFLIMDFLESFYNLLIEKVEELPAPLQIKSHPDPKERWMRLQRHCIHDVPIPSEYYTYSKDLLENVVEHMVGLSSISINALVKELLVNEG